MLVANNLPVDTLGIGITGSSFLGVSVEVLAFCALWYYLSFIAFHWLSAFSFSRHKNQSA
jgi:hypothetical protein